MTSPPTPQSVPFQQDDNSVYSSPPVRGIRDAGPVVTYFIQAIDGGPIKIGRTGRKIVKQRLAALQTGSAHHLVVRRVVAGDYEAEYHARFAAHRMVGEWFEPTKELRKLARARVGTMKADGESPTRSAYLAGYRDGLRTAHEQETSLLECVDTELQRAREAMRKLMPSEDDLERYRDLMQQEAFARYLISTRALNAHVSGEGEGQNVA